MRKAQITMESLLLYGAAILVVLLAIAALMYFGVFNLGGLLPQKCDLAATNVFSCNAYTVSGSAMEIEVENVHSKSIGIIDATFMPDDTGLVSTCTYTAPTGGSALPAVAPGQLTDFALTCSDVNYDTGDRISGKIQIRYQFTDSNLEQLGQGDMSVTVS